MTRHTASRLVPVERKPALSRREFSKNFFQTKSQFEIFSPLYQWLENRSLDSLKLEVLQNLVTSSAPIPANGPTVEFRARSELNFNLTEFLGGKIKFGAWKTREFARLEVWTGNVHFISKRGWPRWSTASNSPNQSNFKSQTISSVQSVGVLISVLLNSNQKNHKPSKKKRKHEVRPF